MFHLHPRQQAMWFRVLRCPNKFGAFKICVARNGGNSSEVANYVGMDILFVLFNSVNERARDNSLDYHKLVPDKITDLSGERAISYPRPQLLSIGRLVSQVNRAVS